MSDQSPSSGVQHGADYLFDELDKLGAHITYTACKALVTKLYTFAASSRNVTSETSALLQSTKRDDD